MNEPYVGMWDYCGACAPSEDGRFEGQGKTFSLGCFQWKNMKRGPELIRGKALKRFSGRSDDPGPTYAAARKYCADRNGNEVAP